MIAKRVSTLFLLSAIAAAQGTRNSKAKPISAEPGLPVVSYSAGVIEGSVLTISKPSTVYDTWRGNRKGIGQFSEGDIVHEFGGICVTRKPDRFLIKKANPDSTLKPGDVILMYGHWGEGNADIWANGGWHRDFDWDEPNYGHMLYREKEGTLWPALMTGKWELALLEPGIREWWVRVGKNDGLTGWILAQKNLKADYVDMLSSATPDDGVTATIIPVPKLPLTDYSTCPGDDRIVANWKIKRADRMYSSFQDGRTLVAALNAGESLTVLRGVNIIREPDKAVIRAVSTYDDSSTLKVGDVAYGYGVEPDQNFIFWSNGVWFEDYIESVAEKGQCGFTSGFGPGGCDIDLIKDGVSEWWVQVKTRKGIEGWMLAERINGDKRWEGNFSDLCHYGED